MVDFKKKNGDHSFLNVQLILYFALVTFGTIHNTPVDVEGCMWYPHYRKINQKQEEIGKENRGGKMGKNLLTFCRNQIPDCSLKDILDLLSEGSISGACSGRASL